MDMIGLFVQFLLGLLLASTGLAKLADARRFRSAVADYRILPSALVPPVARLVPAVEVAAAAALLTGVAETAGLVAAGAAFLVFAAAMAVTLARGRAIDCGCGPGDRAHPVTWTLVARNVLLTAAAVTAAVLVDRPGWDTRLPVLLAAASTALLIALAGAARAVQRHPVLAGAAR